MPPQQAYSLLDFIDEILGFVSHMEVWFLSGKAAGDRRGT
jgi:hypothetical protein